MGPARHVRAAARALAFLAALVLSCADEGVVHVEEAEGCDPLVPELCALPYPSMAGLREDPSTETGFRTALLPEALPRGYEGVRPFVERWNEADGFSVATPFLALIHGDAAIDRSTLPTVDDLAASVEATSSVQLLDRDTGERYPVWAELDLGADRPEEQTLIIRPMKALPFGKRVAVVVTDSLRLESGEPPPPPAPFAALRDRRETDDPRFEGRRETFEELFAFLEDNAIGREHVLLAWEAVTFSERFALSTLTAAVEAAVEAYEDRGAAYRITRCLSSEESDRVAFGCGADEGDGTPLDARVWRRIYGEVDLPRLVGEDGYLVRDAEGLPQVEGTFTAEFVVSIPASLRDAGAGTAPVVTFGHGLLLGPASYLADDLGAQGQLELSDRMGAIFIGTRWHGLSDAERQASAEVISDLGSSFTFHDALVQGIVNQVLMAPFGSRGLAADPLLQASDGSGSLVDAAHLFYTGISLGGIFGTTLMAVSPYVQTGVLHVPAGAFAHMLPHSSDFVLLDMVLEAVVEDPRDQQLFLAMAQRLFDVGDPVNYVGALVDRPATPLGPKSCLWQCAIGDSQAPWYGCDMLVRSGGFAVAAPAVRPVYGLGEVATPTGPGSSAMQQFDPGLGMPSLDNDDVRETGAHTAIRRNPEVQLQTVDYLDPDEPGRIVNHCGGPCRIDPVPAPEE